MDKAQHSQDPVVAYKRIQRLLAHWTIEEHLKKSFTLLALGTFLLTCAAIPCVSELAPADAGLQPVLWMLLAWLVFVAILSVAVIRIETREKERL